MDNQRKPNAFAQIWERAGRTGLKRAVWSVPGIHRGFTWMRIRALEHKMQSAGNASRAPRMAHIYSVGAPKTGTTTIAGIVGSALNSSHEPLAFDFLTRWYRRDLRMDDADLRAYLLRRDAFLNLDLESAHYLHLVTPALAELFPESKFIMTIRDCYTWLVSMVNEQYLFELQWRYGFWNRWFELALKSGPHDHPPDELFLRDQGLPSIANLFQYWRDHNQWVLDSVPPERLLVVRTSEIDSSHEQLAAFCGIDPRHLQDGPYALKTRSEKPMNLHQLSSDYIEEQAARFCKPLMSRFFPEIDHARVALLRD